MDRQGKQTNDRDAAIQTMLEQFAQSFTRGDGAGAARCWEVPALVVSDDGSRPVSSLAEVEAFFGGAAEQYTSRGITDTRPDIRKLDWLTDRLVNVTVDWPYIGEQGDTGARESSTYLCHVDDSGTPKIVVAAMMGSSQPS